MRPQQFIGIVIMLVGMTINLQAQDKKKENVTLLTQMTSEERDALPQPVEGMVIYNSTVKKPQYYNGEEWKYFEKSPHFIGEEFGGGIVFYVDSTGEHGMIIAKTDQHSGAKWGRGDEKSFEANGRKAGTGRSNTDKIARSTTLPDAAARLCSDLEFNYYSDWYLPSLDELILAYKNLKLKDLGNFVNGEYWTSSETDFNNAWLVNFNTGIPTENNVSKPCHVRAIRYF